MGMEQFQLLNMEEDDPVENHITSDSRRSSSRNLRRSSHDNGSLESLNFNFDSSRPSGRLAQRMKPGPGVQSWLIAGIACCVCFVLGYFAYHISHNQPFTDPDESRINGSWKDDIYYIPDFSRCRKGFDAPVVLVMSFDGLRADFIDKLPTLRLASDRGLRAAHMRPVFPTSTFPNHYSMATGLYPESHGIIDNAFNSSDNNREFSISKGTYLSPEWWKGRPIWQVAQEQGKRAAVLQWPGCDVVINKIQPTVWTKFSNETVEDRAKSITNMLELPKDKRPHLILSYYYLPDDEGHRSGLHSDGFKHALSSADQLADLVLQGLYESKLLDCVDIMFVSDHGVEDCKAKTYPISKLKTKLGGNAEKLYLFEGTGTQNRINPTFSGLTVPVALESLACESKDSPYQVYKKEDLPRRLHFINSDLIAPILLTTNISVVLRSPESDRNCSSESAMHGWDNLYSSMQAVFVAYGPSFRTHLAVEPFQNIELFNLFADLLGISAGDNNGTSGSLHHILRKPISVSPDASLGQNVETFMPVCMDTGKSQSLTPVCLPTCPMTQSALSTLSGKDVFHAGSFGYPRTDDSGRVKLLLNRNYAVGVNDVISVPVWAAYYIENLASLIQSQGSIGELFAKNSSCYHRDPRLNMSRSVCPHDDVLPAFLYPAGFVSEDSDTLLQTNVVPMYATFKTGIWKRFWDMLIASESPSERLQVFVGPVFDSRPPFGFVDRFVLDRRRVLPRQLSERVILPSHYFVIVSRKSRSPKCEAVSCLFDVMAFVLPHQPLDSHPCQNDRFYFLTHSATVRDVELLTGLLFFGDLPVDEAARLKTRLTDFLWDDYVPL